MTTTERIELAATMLRLAEAAHAAYRAAQHAANVAIEGAAEDADLESQLALSNAQMLVRSHRYGDAAQLLARVKRHEIRREADRQFSGRVLEGRLWGRSAAHLSSVS